MTRNTSINMTTKTTGCDQLTPGPVHIGVNDLKKGKWYKFIDLETWLVAYANPKLEGRPIGTVSGTNLFMFLELPPATGLERHSRLWMHLGFQEIFAYVLVPHHVAFQAVEEPVAG